MVIGLDRFRQHFSPYTNHYVLIGGTACTVIMQESGLDFRATKDLDVVLYVEALNTEFATVFWKFIEEGGYKTQQQSSGKEVFYRFASPSSRGNFKTSSVKTIFGSRCRKMQFRSPEIRSFRCKSRNFSQFNVAQPQKFHFK